MEVRWMHELPKDAYCKVLESNMSMWYMQYYRSCDPELSANGSSTRGDEKWWLKVLIPMLEGWTFQEGMTETAEWVTHKDTSCLLLTSKDTIYIWRTFCVRMPLCGRKEPFFYLLLEKQAQVFGLGNYFFLVCLNNFCLVWLGY